MFPPLEHFHLGFAVALPTKKDRKSQHQKVKKAVSCVHQRKLAQSDFSSKTGKGWFPFSVIYSFEV